VAAVLAVLAMARRLHVAPPPWARIVPAYAIGGIAMFWTIQRVIAF